MSIAIAVPPRRDQDEIIGKVTEETASLRLAISRTRRQLELVQEYRTKLIADVVTGKLDVREAAAQLPEVGDEQDPIEEGDLFVEGLYDPDESVEESAMEAR